MNGNRLVINIFGSAGVGKTTKSEVNRIYVKQLFAGKAKGAERQIG